MLKITPSVDIEKIKTKALKDLNDSTESFRSTLVTPGSAQAMVYLRKETEARAYIANPGINQDEIPHIVSEAQAVGLDMATYSNIVVSKANSWAFASSAIEAERQRRIMLIENAEFDHSELADKVSQIQNAAIIDWQAFLDEKQSQ